jgi:hypothetical protein
VPPRARESGTRAALLVAAFACACNALSGAADLTVGEAAPDGGVPARASPDAAVGPGGDAATPDARPADGGDAGTDAAVDAFCDEASADLLLCMTMEGALADQSVHGLQPSTATGVTFDAGRVGLAGVFTVDSFVAIAEADAMAAPTYTTEAFVLLRSLPSTARGVVVDFDGRFSMAITSGGQLACRGGGVPVTGGAISLGKWVHVACVEDGTSTVRLYVDGTQAASSASSPISLTGNGAAVGMNAPSGENLDGLIDELRVWTSVRSAAQIAESAKRGQ